MIFALNNILWLELQMQMSDIPGRYINSSKMTVMRRSGRVKRVKRQNWGVAEANVLVTRVAED